MAPCLWRIFCQEKTDPSDQRPAFLKMLFLVKISVAIDLDPFSYATKITSSLAFKQVVEWVGIFCNFSEHPLQIPCSCPSFWKTTQAMHFALLQEELDLVLPVQGAEGTPLKPVTWLLSCTNMGHEIHGLTLCGWKLSMISTRPPPYESMSLTGVCKTIRANVKGLTILQYSHLGIIRNRIHTRLQENQKASCI